MIDPIQENSSDFASFSILSRPATVADNRSGSHSVDRPGWPFRAERSLTGVLTDVCRPIGGPENRGVGLAGSFAVVFPPQVWIRQLAACHATVQHAIGGICLTLRGQRPEEELVRPFGRQRDYGVRTAVQVWTLAEAGSSENPEELGDA